MMPPDERQYGEVCAELLEIDIRSNAIANAAIVNPIWKFMGKFIKEKGKELEDGFNARKFFEVYVI